MGDVNAVDVQGLVVEYRGHKAVDGIDLQLPEGLVCVLLGPNGAGKTSTLSTVLGLRSPDAGTVKVLGRQPHDPWLRGKVGVLLQDGGLPVAARPAAIVSHFASFYDNPLPVPALLEALGLEDLHRPYRRLSGGEQQRVKIAVAIVGRPRLLVLDEPTTGMDPAARRSFWTLLDDLREQGITTLLTTHQPDEASPRADRIVIMHQGRVVADAPPEELIENAPVWFTSARHLDLTSLLSVLGDGFDVVEVEPGRYRVHGRVDVPQISAIRSWAATHGDAQQEVSVVRTLEEAYLDMTGGTSW